MIATSDANHPCTKNLSIKYHHFCDYILRGTIQVFKVHTNDNWADIFTKPLSHIKFKWLCLLLMGWWCLLDAMQGNWFSHLTEVVSPAQLLDLHPAHPCPTSLLTLDILSQGSSSPILLICDLVSCMMSIPCWLICPFPLLLLIHEGVSHLILLTQSDDVRIINIAEPQRN